jgi:uncharacterized FAD-dependent dehydrogenase
LRQDHEVIIVGAGPAGIFAAIELLRSGVRDIAIIEKGKPIECRSCPVHEHGCIRCPSCDIMTGWGGAGAFSDGKLTLTGEVGGWLGEYIGAARLDSLIEYTDGVWLEFGADPQVHGPDAKTAARLKRQATSAGMTLTPMTIRHIGSDRSPQVLGAMHDYLVAEGVDVRTKTSVTSFLVADGQVRGVVLGDGSELHAKAVIVAPGREGAEWLASQAVLLGIALSSNQVDVGVRVETPASVMEALTRDLYEAKLTYLSTTFGDRVRTFCMNPYGEVTTESYGDVVTVNGHSYAERRTPYTNFAVLVSQKFTHPFREPITYGRSIAHLANLLGESILVQRLGDLKAGRRSTPERIAQSIVRPTMPGATPGDLASVLPYRHLTDILEFLEAMELLAPGVAAPSTLLYGVEVKFYSSRLDLDATLQTPVRGLYAVGDGAGVTRGLVQSAASGVVAARAIAGA